MLVVRGLVLAAWALMHRQLWWHHQQLDQVRAGKV